MLKFLFGRTSSVVRLLELVGVVNSAVYLSARAGAHRNTPLLFFFLFLLLCYLFVRVCDGINWYPREKTPPEGPRRLGIRVHFQKALVPTSYILAVASAFLLLAPPLVAAAVMAFADLLMIVVVSVNGILIYFHLRNRDSLPINYFSSNKYLSSY